MTIFRKVVSENNFWTRLSHPEGSQPLKPNNAEGPALINTTAARGGGERVIVVSHNPLVAEAAAPQCVLWNAEDVLAVIARFRDTVGV